MEWCTLVIIELNRTELLRINNYAVLPLLRDPPGEDHSVYIRLDLLVTAAYSTHVLDTSFERPSLLNDPLRLVFNCGLSKGVQ